MKLFVRILAFLFLISFTVGVQASILLLNFNKNNSTSTEVIKYAQSVNQEVFEYPNNEILEITKDTLSSIFKEVIRRSSTPVHTIVFSGHASTESFSGHDGSLRRYEVYEVLQNYPEIANSVQRLVLRGCYTGVLSGVLYKSGWRKVFKNLVYLAGYTDRAWSSETDFSKFFVYDSLKLSNRFIKSKALEESVSIFKQIRQYKNSAIGIWHISKDSDTEVYLTTKTVISGNNIIDLSQLKKACLIKLELKQTHKVVVEKYNRGEDPGYERPPAETSASSLRSAYAWLMKNNYCADLKLWELDAIYNPEKSLGLLFYNNIVNNYLNFYSIEDFKNQITELNRYIKEPLKLPELKTSSRGSLIKFSHQLGTLLSNKYYNELSQVAESFFVKRLEYYSLSINELLVNLNPNHIPRRWVTEQKVILPPLFLHREKRTLKKFNFIELN